MPVDIELLARDAGQEWDEYVEAHAGSSLYQLSGWREVIESTYGHTTRFLLARRDGVIRGVCPLVHLKHRIFGNSLYSLPFFDLGGILADDDESAHALLRAAIEQGRALGADDIELRQPAESGSIAGMNDAAVAVDHRSHKVRMVLDLPASADELMSSFKTKFRTKVRLPARKGCTCRSGGIELVDDFYTVFSINMRDLGSPVHSRRLIENVMRVFGERARLFIVDREDEQLAAGMVIGFRNLLYNPWASSLKAWSSIRPNTLLYWSILEYAIEQGFERFDFGRSDPGGNTFVFKQQWGAQPVPVHWYRLNLHGNSSAQPAATDEKLKFDRAIELWKKLPLPVANVIGPGIRKHIGL